MVQKIPCIVLEFVTTVKQEQNEDEYALVFYTSWYVIERISSYVERKVYVISITILHMSYVKVCLFYASRLASISSVPDGTSVLCSANTLRGHTVETRGWGREGQKWEKR